ncbi:MULTISPECIES: aggregation-promoting factor C-terminal-like domain-containing protein [unclassified Isoptericola]|uniref:aggregation-promoting factor C-terminal-like domain-containing protein n=1 Tax=unclassified Isoptericola TaxID=2623355 RepID=UPI0036579312
MRRSRAERASDESTAGRSTPRRGALTGPARHVVHGAVVVALVGSTAVVAHAHKSVTIDYDGRVATVDAYGTTVAEVLRSHHITPGPDDLVQPAVTSAAKDGGEVVVRSSREVTVEIDGEVTTFPTTAHTVGELLAALGPRGDKAVTSASRTAPLDRAPVRVSTMKTVQVAVDGLVLPIRTTQATVRDVLATAHITLGEQDRTSVPLGAAAVDGMVVMVSRGDTDADRVTEVVPFETERVESAELPKGYEVVRTSGVPGERVTTYEVRTLDGAEVQRTVLDRKVTREPVTEVIVVGTLDVSSANPDPGSAKAIGKAMAAERGWGADQYVCLEKLWDKESGWRWNAENPSSGAYGIPQALPGTKMASAGADWRTNPSTQIEWGLGYIAGRYGTPCGAWSHSMSVGWY